MEPCSKANLILNSENLCLGLLRQFYSNACDEANRNRGYMVPAAKLRGLTARKPITPPNKRNKQTI